MTTRGSEYSRLRRFRNIAFVRQGGKCHWCGSMMIPNTERDLCDHPRFCTGDHLVPMSRGGLTEESNIVAACKTCNNHRQQTPRQTMIILGDPEASRATLADVWPKSSAE